MFLTLIVGLVMFAFLFGLTDWLLVDVLWFAVNEFEF